MFSSFYACKLLCYAKVNVSNDNDNHHDDYVKYCDLVKFKAGRVPSPTKKMD